MGEWSHKPCPDLPGEQYEIVVDGHLAATVELMPSFVPRRALAIREVVRAFADAHDGTVAAPSLPAGRTVDWEALGWTDQAEHDAMVADVHRFIDRWRGHTLEQQFLSHVNERKIDHEIPHRPPYSLDQLDDLDRIVRRTPHIVLQDVAAEGVAA